MSDLRTVTDDIAAQEEVLRAGGGAAGHARQKKLGRLPVRERLKRLLDDPSDFLELNLWAAFEMYDEWGAVPAAGVVTGIGTVAGRPSMIVANDATVKAGAFFPQTAKKVLRAQRAAFRCNLPLIYLVDSSGVFLPMQDEIFPDEDDFGRIFRNNAVLSAAGVPQFSAIMGNCVAGGAYLPVLCDKLLMTEGSALYLAGPSLVKAAIGQEVDAESLGGAEMHSTISGTVDFCEQNDEDCIDRLRDLVGLLPAEKYGVAAPHENNSQPAEIPQRVYDLFHDDQEYDVRELLNCVVDRDTLNEYKAEYGKTLVTAYARVGGRPVGIVANQRVRSQSEAEGIQVGGVIYAQSADKAARFVMDCNQSEIPLVFFQDVTGFMVGRDAEHSGIIRNGAKLVSAVSNSIVPKITIITGGSFGAGHYAMCGKAFDPHFIFAWPGAKYSVMGGSQAAQTLLALEERQAKRAGRILSDEDRERMHAEVEDRYNHQMDIRYGAARGWVDAIITPDQTREVLIKTLAFAARPTPAAQFHTGVLQV